MCTSLNTSPDFRSLSVISGRRDGGRGWETRDGCDAMVNDEAHTSDLMEIIGLPTAAVHFNLLSIECLVNPNPILEP